MGGAVGSLQNDSKIPKDTLDKVVINRDVKRQIAQKDAKLLKKQLREPWKPHKEIIKLLTERTKHQLGLFLFLTSPASLTPTLLPRVDNLHLLKSQSCW